MIEIRWHGRGGQGSFTVARILGMAASVYGGKYSMAFPSFGPERRGAPVLGFTKISEDKITDRSEVNECDYVIVLDETLWGPAVTNGLKENTIIIVNTKDISKYKTGMTTKIIGIDGTSLALDILNLPITNIAMLGALIGASEITSIENCKSAIRESMNPKIAEKNILLMEETYRRIKEVL